jgi:hypothetical protein
MARYLYKENGGEVGYMDQNDKYLYSTDGQAIAYWDSRHKWMYTPSGQPFGYLDSRGLGLYSQSGQPVGYFLRNTRARAKACDLASCSAAGCRKSERVACTLWKQ